MRPGTGRGLEEARRGPEEARKRLGRGQKRHVSGVAPSDRPVGPGSHQKRPRRGQEEAEKDQKRGRGQKMPRLEEPGRGQPRGGAPGEAGSPPGGGGARRAPKPAKTPGTRFRGRSPPQTGPGAPRGGGAQGCDGKKPSGLGSLPLYHYRG